MSYDVVVFGSLVFPQGKAEQWRAAPVATAGRADLARAFPGSPDAEAASVGAAIAALGALQGEGGGERFEAELEGGEVVLRGVLGQDTFHEQARLVAALLFAAADHGAHGGVTMAGVGADLGYRFSLGRGKAHLEELGARESREAARSPEARALSDYAIPSAARAILADAKARHTVRAAAPPPAPAPRPDAAAAASALAALQKDAVATLREGPEPHVSQLAAATAEMNRWVDVLVDAHHEPAVPFIVSLWRSHPWPFVRKHMERHLLDWGTPAAVAPIAEKLEDYARATDEDGAQSLAAIEAVFLHDPAAAYDRLRPYFDRPGDAVADAIAQGVFALLAFAGDDRAFATYRREARGWLQAEPRWRDLAVRVLEDRDDGAVFGAITVLVVTRDARAGAALVALLDAGTVEVDTVIAALRTLGDAAAAPLVARAAQAHKRRKADAAKLTALAAELSTR